MSQLAPAQPTPDVTRIALSTSRVVVNVTRAVGGKSSESEVVQVDQNGDARDTYRRTIEHVDHVEACKAIDKAVARVRKAISRHTTYTPLGYLVPEDRVPDLENALQTAYAACYAANHTAFQLGSQRRVHPGIVYLAADLSDPSVARHVYLQIIDRLDAIATFLRLGNPDQAGHVKPELENVAELACGIQRQAIVACIQAIPSALASRRNGEEPNLGAFRAAIKLFTR